uniref:Uncharacterized protein n=1 Tax=Aegilops tauschii subsp. strangulata TaxID=200361 RepID=A0A453IM41_AEGTS
PSLIKIMYKSIQRDKIVYLADAYSREHHKNYCKNCSIQSLIFCAHEILIHCSIFLVYM